MSNWKLNQIMLVDDDDIDNMLHKRVIDRAGVTESVISFTQGQKALDYLKNSRDHMVDIIFLDIRMPGMDGFEFLEHYKALDKEKRAEAIVVMLSSSQWRGDVERSSEATTKVVDYLEKPLTTECLLSVLEEHFPSDQRK